jgi:hypothetical protein
MYKSYYDRFKIELYACYRDITINTFYFSTRQRSLHSSQPPFIVVIAEGHEHLPVLMTRILLCAHPNGGWDLNIQMITEVIAIGGVILIFKCRP